MYRRCLILFAGVLTLVLPLYLSAQNPAAQDLNKQHVDLRDRGQDMDTQGNGPQDASQQDLSAPLKPKDCKKARTLSLKITVNKSRVINLEKFDPELGQVSVVTKEIANVPSPANDKVDVYPLNLRQLYIVGKQLGTTHVMLWDQEGCVFKIYDVEVTHDLQTLQAKLHQLIPDERPEVYSSQGALVLGGQISNMNRMDAAMKLAQSFAGEKNPVVNLMQVGGAQQVLLEVKVAEISRRVLKKLGVNLIAFSPHYKWGIGAVKGGASFPNADFGGDALDGGIPLLGPATGRDLPLNPVIGPLIDLFDPVTPAISDAGLFAYSISKNLFFNATIDALKDTGLAKVLAEPNLTTLSGQEAQFRSGGQFPVPVPQQNGAVTIEFKDFGVGVNFLPVVLDANRINLKLNISVSELSSSSVANIGVSNTNSVIVVPSLTLRSATSTVELADGQAIAIAGLISDNMREAVNKFPGLGDVPGLGLLFRSQEFQKDQSELVIFVTPHLAQPVPPQQVRLPTESFVEPSDVEFYLMGKMEGRSRNFDLSAPQSQGGGLEGEFGHDL